MAESSGLPAWVGSWVGKVVQVHVHGDPDPLLGILEDWDERGVVLRHTEDLVRTSQSQGDEEAPQAPMMILVTWSAVRYVSVLLEDLEQTS